MAAGGITPFTPTIDNGQQITLAASPTGGTPPYSYHWYLDGTCTNSISGADSPTYIASPSVATTYSYRVSDSANSPESKCSTGDLVNVNSAFIPGVITPAAPTIDSGQSVVLKATPSGGTTPYTYQWYSGTSATCSSDATTLGTSPVQVVSPTSSTYYCYTVTDSAFAHATQSSATDLLTVNPGLVAGDITPSNPTIDSGQSVVLTANPSGGSAPYAYQWYSGTSLDCSSDTAPLGTSSTQTVSSTVTAYYCYRVTDSSAGNPAASASSTTDFVTVSSALTIPTLTAISPIDNGQATALTVSWSGGTSPYTVNLYTSTSSSSCTGLVQVLQNRGVTGTSTTFSQSPSSGTSYCASVTDSASSAVTKQTTSPHSVTVNAALVVKTIAATPSTIDIGQSSTLSTTFSGGTSPYSCQWLQKGPNASGYSDLGGSSSCVSPVSVSTGVLATNGTWSFELQVTDSSGSPATVVSPESTLVVAITPGTLEISITPTTIDAGQSSTLSTPSSLSGGVSPYTCQWLQKAPGAIVYGNLGTAFSCKAGDSPSISTGPLTLGAWSFELQVTDNASTTVTSNTAGVTVNPALVANTITPSSATIDNGQSITLDSHASGGILPLFYQWYADSKCTTAISGATSSAYTALPTATTSYSYKVTDSANSAVSQCSSGDTVIVNPTLSAGAITPLSPKIDKGQNITLIGHATGGTPTISYQWYSDASCTTAIPLATLSFYVATPTLTTTYSYSIIDSASTPVSRCSIGDIVVVNPTLAANPITPSSLTINIGQSITLTAHPSGGTSPYSYQWYSGTSATCSTDTALLGAASTQNVSPIANTYYCYTVTDSSVGTPLANAMSLTDFVSVDPPLVVDAPSIGSSSIDSGQSTTLSTSFNGGTPPYTCFWLEKTPGASSYSKFASSSTCESPEYISTGSLTTIGTWSFEFEVSDSSSSSVTVISNVATVNVNPPLTSPIINVTPSTVNPGQAAMLSTTTSFSGGTSPYTCQWLKKGPADSGYSNLGSSFSCIPGNISSKSTGLLPEAGSWSFELQVTDSSGSSVTSGSAISFQRAGPTIAVSLSVTRVTIGGSVTGSSILSGGLRAGGNVTYEYFTASGCTGTATTVGPPVTVTDGVVPNSASRSFSKSGSFSWDARYSGDSSNAPSISTCEPLIVAPLLSVPGLQTVQAGSTVRFVVNASDPSQMITLMPGSLPYGAQFSTSQSYVGGSTLSAIFTWTPSASLAAGDYNVTFTAVAGGVSTSSQVTIHVVAPSKAAPLPLFSYSIFGIVGFVAVIGSTLLLRRFQAPRRRQKP